MLKKRMVWKLLRRLCRNTAPDGSTGAESAAAIAGETGAAANPGTVVAAAPDTGVAVASTADQVAAAGVDPAFAAISVAIPSGCHLWTTPVLQSSDISPKRFESVEALLYERHLERICCAATTAAALPLRVLRDCGLG